MIYPMVNTDEDVRNIKQVLLGCLLADVPMTFDCNSSTFYGDGSLNYMDITIKLDVSNMGYIYERDSVKYSLNGICIRELIRTKLRKMIVEDL